ncbi:MAG: TolC family protein, partial [Pseudomonadota bacterium]
LCGFEVGVCGVGSPGICLADIEQSNLESLEETLGFVSIQFERGLRSSEDIALIKADVETSRASLDLAQRVQRDASRAIEILIGRYPAASLEVGSEAPTRPIGSLIGKPADLLERRPDVCSAKLTLLGQYARTRSARADLLPRLSAQANFDGTNTAIEDLFDPSALAASLLVNATQAVFDGGARRARIEAAEADAEIALANYQLLVLDAFNEVEAELDRGRVLDRREVFLSNALSEAEDALQFSRFRYELGESDLLNVLSIQQRVASLQAELARTRRARLDQYVSLALALGRDV